MARDGAPYPLAELACEREYSSFFKKGFLTDCALRHGYMDCIGIFDPSVSRLKS